MGKSSVKYAALPTEEDRMDSDFKDEHVMEYGTPEGTFGSAFTYANYNDLDRMGYQTANRYTNSLGNRYGGAFTYSSQFNNEEVEVHPMNAIELIIYGLSVIAMVFTLPFSLFFTLKFVSASEKLVVLRLGRAQKPRGPGATFVLPCIDTTHKITTTVTAFNVPPMQVITTDRGLVEVGATVFLKIRDPISAVCGVQDRNSSTRNLANTMMYRYTSKKRICELTNPNNRRIMAAAFKDELGSFTSQFGVEITEVEFADPKVMKEGENMGMSALSAVSKSETGKKIWEVIEPHVKDFARETAAAKQGGEVATHFSSDDTSDAMSPGLDVDHLVTVINMAIDEHLTRAVGKLFQVNCSGMESIYIDLKHPPGSCAKGYASCPDVTFETTQIVFFQLIKKSISPINAYMDGSLKIKGEIQDALSLKYLAERVSQLL